MDVTDPIDLNPHHLEIVNDILAKHISEYEVRAFGSRANWTAGPASDLDLAVVGEGPIPQRVIARLREDFDDSYLPIRVDIHDWYSIPDNFRLEIKNSYTTLRMPKPPRGVIASIAEVIRVNPRLPLLKGVEAPFVPMASVSVNQRLVSISEFRAYKGSGSRFMNGDTLLARITPCLENGKTAWVSGLPDGTVGHGSTEFIVLSPIDEITDPLFVYYLARSPAFRSFAIGQMTGTSGRQRVPVDVIKHYRISLPSLTIQRTISHILGTLDDRIELNRQMNETLEEMARTLFKSWFVDFDPVRAKMEGRDTGLPRDIADLFPDRLVDSELGPVPRGWRVFRIDELTYHHTTTVSPLRSPKVEYEHFSIPAYDANRQPTIELGKAIRSNKTVVPDDAVLLSKLNLRIARVWIPSDSKKRPQVCSTEFLVFTPRPPANRSLLFSLFLDDNFRALLKSMVTGTSKSHQRVPPQALKLQEVLAGSPELFLAYGHVTGDMMMRILRNRSESSGLGTQRDTLLPKLVSGEISVKDVESSAQASL